MYYDYYYLLLELSLVQKSWSFALFLCVATIVVIVLTTVSIVLDIIVQTSNHEASLSLHKLSLDSESHATSIKPSSLQCVCSCSTTSSHYLRHQAPEPIDSNQYVRRTAEIWKKTWNDHEISEVIQFCGVMFFCKQKNMEPKPKKWWRFPWLITMSHLSAIDPCQCSSFHNRSASSHSHPLPGDGSKKLTPNQFPSFQWRPWWNLWRLFSFYHRLS